MLTSLLLWWGWEDAVWEGPSNVHDQMALLKMVFPPVYCLQSPLGQELSLKPIPGYSSEIWVPLESEPSHLSSKILFPGPESSSFWLSVTKGFIPFFNGFFLNNCVWLPITNGSPWKLTNTYFFSLSIALWKPRHYKHKCLFSFSEKRGMVLSTLIFSLMLPHIWKNEQRELFTGNVLLKKDNNKVSLQMQSGSIGFKFQNPD